MTTRRWLSLDTAIQYAKGYGEEADVMESADGRSWYVVHPYGTTLWREHGYKVVAQVRLQVVVIQHKWEKTDA